MKQKLIHYLTTYKKALYNRDYILDLLTPCQRTILDPQSPNIKQKFLYVGKIFQHATTGELCIVSIVHGDTPALEYEVLAKDTVKAQQESLLELDDHIELVAGMIKNYTEEIPLTTTVGRFIVNQVVLAGPFGAIVPYKNDVLTGASLDKEIYNLILEKKLNVDQYKVYTNNIYYLGNLSELGVPVYTPKSMTTSKDVIARRDELLEQYKDELKAGDPIVMSKIENELIGMDKDYLKGDPSTLFVSKKGYNVQRKKLHIIGGMGEKFGETGYNWVGRSLDEGANQDNYAIMADEVRGGSYSRAMETADGGVEGKVLTRTFQEARITQDDCGSTQYISILMKPDTYMQYEGRIALVGGKLREMSVADLQSNIGSVVKIRSPMFCQTPNGFFCYTCFGGRIMKIRQNVLTMMANTISAFFLNASLKKSHGVQTNTGEITDLDEFVMKS